MVTTATGQDDLENPIHQALQPRPIVDALLVSLNFTSIKNIFNSVFLTVILSLSSSSMYSINYIWVYHMSGKDQKRNHGILWEVGMLACWHVKKKLRKN